jgi:hypothetical protein
MRETTGAITNMGSGNGVRSMKFESIAKYTNAQLTPIDLTKITR